MISEKVQKKLVRLAYDLQYVPDANQKHFTFVLKRNKVVSVGWNSSYKTHPLANKYGHLFNSIHSECAAIVSLKGKVDNNYKLVNIRITPSGKIGRSFPCESCKELLSDFNFKKIICSDNNGQFLEYNING